MWAGAATRFIPDAMAALINYSWPGNVRELANVIERAQISAMGTLFRFRICRRIWSPLGHDDRRRRSRSAVNLERIERRTVLSCLQHTRGNKVNAAKALGVSRRALLPSSERHGISTPQ